MRAFMNFNVRCLSFYRRFEKRKQGVGAIGNVSGNEGSFVSGNARAKDRISIRSAGRKFRVSYRAREG